MNILFVLYGDFGSNSANPLVLYARELHSLGHSCAVAVPFGVETVRQHDSPKFRPVLFSEALKAPDSIFPDKRPADVIHACTPRENIRRFVTSYMAKRPTPLVIYLEDNESWIATRALGFDPPTLVRHTEAEISAQLPNQLAHPFFYDSFIGLADAVAVIQDKLRTKVPPWVSSTTVLIGTDVQFFSPRQSNPARRAKYGIGKSDKVIVYHGGMNEFTRPSIRTLCEAVGLINRQGYTCRLLRSGPFALDFLAQMSPETKLVISDVGLLPRQELPDFLALADVFVQPGQIDPFEDFRLPGKVAEFLAMGRPVVLPNVNIADLFRDGENALLLNRGSADEIAAKCIELFANPQLAREIGRAGREFAEKFFDVRCQARRLEDVYRAARDQFNPAIASETWRDANEKTPVALLLAAKLKLLAASNPKSELAPGDLLSEHARYIELMQQRVEGLQAAIAERDANERNAHILSLTRQIAERDSRMSELNRALDGLLNSFSWKITRPLRVAKAVVKLARQRIDTFWRHRSK